VGGCTGAGRSASRRWRAATVHTGVRDLDGAAASSLERYRMEEGCTLHGQRGEDVVTGAGLVQGPPVMPQGAPLARPESLLSWIKLV
jgi:hypothetical protein